MFLPSQSESRPSNQRSLAPGNTVGLVSSQSPAWDVIPSSVELFECCWRVKRNPTLCQPVGVADFARRRVFTFPIKVAQAEPSFGFPCRVRHDECFQRGLEVRPGFGELVFDFCHVGERNQSHPAAQQRRRQFLKIQPVFEFPDHAPNCVQFRAINYGFVG